MKRYLISIIVFTLMLSTSFATANDLRLVNASGAPITITFIKAGAITLPLENGNNSPKISWFWLHATICRDVEKSCSISFRVNGQRKAYAIINTEAHTLVKIHSIHSMGLTAGYANGKLSSLIFAK